MSDSIRVCNLMNCGLVPYKLAWDWQKQWVNDRKQSPDLPDLLCLLEHPSVYTLGQASDTSFVDRKSTRLNSSHRNTSRMPSSA